MPEFLAIFWVPLAMIGILIVALILFVVLFWTCLFDFLLNGPSRVIIEHEQLACSVCGHPMIPYPRRRYQVWQYVRWLVFQHSHSFSDMRRRRQRQAAP
jgi:hypothetical protein